MKFFRSVLAFLRDLGKAIGRASETDARVRHLEWPARLRSGDDE